MSKFSPLVALAVLVLFSGCCNADPFIDQPFRVLLPSDQGTLEALMVRPSDPGRYPLALISHGSPRSPADRPNMTPLAMLPEALEFARRGWAAAVVMRRGYGGSDGGWAESFGGCANPNYVAAGIAGAADIKRSIEFLSHRTDVDPTRMIAVGVSAGGFATVALTADPPPGLTAAISFAGGRGSMADNEVCQDSRLVDAFRVFGSHSRIPMLWVYAENDHFFGPKLADKLRAAFTDGGGIVDFVHAPAFGSDGHGLFSAAGIPVWTPYVDKFLQQQNLVIRTTPLPLPTPDVPPPSALSADGRNAFQTYLISAPHKAFAVSSDGAYGWRSGQRTLDAAKAGALTYCQQSGKRCQVVVVDDAAAGTVPVAH